MAVVTPLPVACGDLDGATFLGIYPELVRRGTALLTDHAALSASPGELRIANVYSGAELVVPADTLVACMGRRAVGGALHDDLVRAGVASHVTVVGDAAVPRDAAAAVRDAYRLASDLAIG